MSDNRPTPLWAILHPPEFPSKECQEAYEAMKRALVSVWQGELEGRVDGLNTLVQWYRKRKSEEAIPMTFLEHERFLEKWGAIEYLRAHLHKIRTDWERSGTREPFPSFGVRTPHAMALEQIREFMEENGIHFEGHRPPLEAGLERPPMPADDSADVTEDTTGEKARATTPIASISFEGGEAVLIDFDNAAAPADGEARASTSIDAAPSKAECLAAVDEALTLARKRSTADSPCSTRSKRRSHDIGETGASGAPAALSVWEGLVEVIRETGGDWAEDSVTEESESATDEESSEEEGLYLSQDDPSVPVPGAGEPEHPLSCSHSLTVEQPSEAGAVRKRAAGESESVSGERESLTERARRMFPRRSRSASPAATPLPRMSAESFEELRDRHLRKYHMDTQEFYSQNKEKYHRPCVKCGHLSIR